ncbi:MAG TPA: NADH-quinone oxidoreductase subunit NuoE [Desulfobacterales bacterium]|nr:NADH-quinone oxidoreductase subunit NuoE [Desulfobacterales bacterium]
MDIETINRILEKFPDEPGNLMGILHEVQNHFRYLPEEELRYISKKRGVPITQIYSIATFYNRFSLKPKGKHLICVCMGTGCHVKGADKVLEEIERELDIGVGETTDDLRFTLEEVGCLGACSLAPAVCIDEEIHGPVGPKEVGKLLEKYQ